MNISSNNIPSMKNIYDSTYWNKIKEDEQSISNDLYKKSMKPYETGVVSKNSTSDSFKRKFYSEINDENDDGEMMGDYTYSLTGEKVNVSSLSHNNMTPFLKKNVTQNTNIDHMSPYLDNLSGNNCLKQKKKEVQCMFKPEINSGGYICGMKNNDDFYKSRIDVSEVSNNFFPIEKIRVGPGLNQGYGNESTGGFQQADTLDYAKPPTLNELRSRINQKQTYFEIPIKGHLKGPDRRGEISTMTKQRPDTVYKQTEDMWLKTTGAYSKNTLKSAQNIRPTARQESHIEYTGSITRSDLNKGINDDYGKSKIILYNNERESTEQRTVVTNVTSIIKALVAPIVDVLKYTNKEYTIESARGVGNPSIQIPSKQTLYDPVNHVMKTTVKETTLHDNEAGNLTGNKETYTAYTDAAKITVKETTLHDNENSNLTGNKETYTAYTDTAKTTIKETTLHDKEEGNLTGNKETYTAYTDAAKTTVKETTLHDNDTCNLKGKNETYSALTDNAKTTIKETTIHDNDTGILTGNKETYSSLTDSAKTTIKETLIHDTVITNVKGNDGIYLKNGDDAKKTLRQTLPVEDTVRNIGGVVYKVTLYDPDIVAKTTTKETTIVGKSEYGFIGGMLEGIFGGYLNKNVEMKNTNKQFTSDVNEFGIAGSLNEHRQTDRTADENAEIDGTREAILMAAGHTPNPGNMNIGIDAENIEMYSKKPIENSFPAREKGNVGIIYQTSPTLDNCGITKIPNKSNAYSNRLDSDLLESVNKNDLMRTQQINPIKSGCKI